MALLTRDNHPRAAGFPAGIRSSSHRGDLAVRSLRVPGSVIASFSGAHLIAGLSQVIERILCPTDFSETSEHARDQAVLIASWYRARLAALHVVSEREADAEHDALERARARTATQFERAAAAGVPLEVFVDTGATAERILNRAVTYLPDLIVMGTHGASGFTRLVLGSVTEKVLRLAVCPVLTVPPRAHATARIPFHDVLCAIDFSACSLAALRLAISLAEEADARLTILHVIEWPWHEPPPPPFDELPPEQAAALAEYRRYAEKSAARRLESLVPDSVRLSHRPEARVRNGKPYVQILEVAAEARSDLIVMGVRGRDPVDMMLFGSAANHVVRTASCPVLTVRG